MVFVWSHLSDGDPAYTLVQVSVMRVTVFRTVPPLIIGTCGVVPNRDFDAFEERLDAPEATGVAVDRLDPSDHNAMGAHSAVERVVRARN
jgi:ACR3 family arsenite efflux pump ArsB